MAHHTPFGIHAGALEAEDFLHGDDIAFHAGQFADAHQTAAAVHRPFDLDDDVERRGDLRAGGTRRDRSEEHTSELQSLMRISYAVFCLKKKTIYQKR